MGESTAVDTQALAAAGRSAAGRARDLTDAVAAASATLALVSQTMSGARSADAVDALRDALTRSLGELAAAVDRLGALLDLAAAAYETAESRALRLASAPSPAGMAARASAGSP